MTHAEIIKRYLKNWKDVDIGQTGFPFVTISRQAGAQGHILGREIIRQLSETRNPHLESGWELFDQKLCALLAQNDGLHTSFESLVEEEYRSGIQQTVYEMFVGRSEQYELQKKIAGVIGLLAALGKVIIIGRGACCVTRGLPQGIHVRLVGPERARIQNVMSELEVREEDAVRQMRQQDEDRERMMRDYFNKDINDPLLYDVVWNVGAVDIPEIAQILVGMINRKLHAKRPAIIS